MRELHIGRLLRDREADLGDEFAGLERGLEQALEIVVGSDAALVGDDRRAERERGRRIVGGRIVVGERAADRAAVAHMRVADAAGELGERRDRALHDRALADLDVAGHGADDEVVALAGDARQIGNAASGR